MGWVWETEKTGPNSIKTVTFSLTLRAADSSCNAKHYGYEVEIYLYIHIYLWYWTDIFTFIISASFS